MTMKSPSCPHCQSPLAAKSSYCAICGMSLRPPASFLRPPESDYAPLFPRILARLVDYTLIGILVCLVDWGSGGALLEGWEWFRLGIRGLSQITLALWVGVILFLGYFVIFHRLSGQTPGKWFCRVAVLKKGVAPAGWVANVLRELGVWLTVLTGGWLFLMCVFSSKNKAFHDFLSGVEVYQVTERS